MEKGIGQIISLLEREVKHDDVLLQFLIEIIRNETFESSGWYKDEYKQKIESDVELWNNED